MYGEDAAFAASGRRAAEAARAAALGGGREVEEVGEEEADAYPGEEPEEGELSDGRDEFDRTVDEAVIAIG